MPTKDVSDQYDETQLNPLSPAPSGIGNLPIADIIEQVRNWFFTNFEDPAHSTPYESAEGGYQYIWGGPYDTMDIVQNIFADELSDDQVVAVTDDINNDGLEWVPNANRQQPPEDDDESELSPFMANSVQLREQMLQQIAEAEKQLRALEAEAGPHGIGHNHPPEAIDQTPATRRDIEELRAAFETLKAQPPVPPDEGRKAADDAKEKVQSTASKITAWLAGQANTFVSEAVKEAGKEAGKWTTRLALWGALAAALTKVSETAGHWLSSFNFPF